MKLLIRIILAAMLFFTQNAFSQSVYQLEWEYRYSGLVSPLSLNADVTGKPFLYVASNEQGFKIFHLDGTLYTTLDTNVLQMSCMSFTQYGNLLYIALGRNGNHDLPGLAIVDVSDPLAPVVKDIWVHPAAPASNGAGIVKVEGSYAYLGAMGLGLDILDISNPANITFVSETSFDIHYPWVGPPAPVASLYNARGMEVKNDIVYLCFDAGGLRIINCTDKLHPRETGHYANPVTYTGGNHPRAYNNIILNDTVAYVTVDYCGLEVLRISDTANITLLDNFNPQNCPVVDWHSSNVHSNEMQYNDDCKQIFMSTGKSEMISVDVSDPHNIDSTGMYGNITDTTATWGIGMRHDSIFLSYLIIPIYIPWLHPFDAKWNGIKMIKWENPCMPLSVTENKEEYLYVKIQPNPFYDRVEIHFQVKSPVTGQIKIFDITGRLVCELDQRQFTQGENVAAWDGKDWQGQETQSGIYFVKIKTGDKISTTKIIKLN